MNIFEQLNKISDLKSLKEYYEYDDNDSDRVYFFKDEETNMYKGQGEIVTGSGETLQQAVKSAIEEANCYDSSMYSDVEIEDEIDYDEADLEDLGYLEITWVGHSHEDEDEDYEDEEYEESLSEDTKLKNFNSRADKVLYVLLNTLRAKGYITLWSVIKEFDSDIGVGDRTIAYFDTTRSVMVNSKSTFQQIADELQKQFIAYVSKEGDHNKKSMYDNATPAEMFNLDPIEQDTSAYDKLVDMVEDDPYTKLMNAFGDEQ